MKLRISAVVAFSFLLCAAAFAQKTNVDWDRQADFSQYHTYAWEPSPHPAHGLWDQRIVDGIDNQLQQKGLKKVDSNPDMWVVYSNSIKDQKTLVGTGYGYGPGWGWGGWGATGPVMYNTYVTKEGTLVVDMADAKNKQLLWRGAVTDTVTDNSNKNIKNLNNSLNKLFKQYPPKGK